MTWRTKERIRAGFAILMAIVVLVLFTMLLCSPYNPFYGEDGEINAWFFPEAAQAQAIQKMARERH